ncbi:hypothetical protein B0O80DRAFT_299905 [Mortierella sp. GBAus27b]|nr:hypothetical protein B0O80DRAFT_299905 [Mortierella sp. GBAus27b]
MVNGLHGRTSVTGDWPNCTDPHWEKDKVVLMRAKGRAHSQDRAGAANVHSGPTSHFASCTRKRPNRPSMDTSRDVQPNVSRCTKTHQHHRHDRLGSPNGAIPFRSRTHRHSCPATPVARSRCEQPPRRRGRTEGNAQLLRFKQLLVASPHTYTHPSILSCGESKGEEGVSLTPPPTTRSSGQVSVARHGTPECAGHVALRWPRTIGLRTGEKGSWGGIGLEWMMLVCQQALPLTCAAWASPSISTPHHPLGHTRHTRLEPTTYKKGSPPASS